MIQAPAPFADLLSAVGEAGTLEMLQVFQAALPLRLAVLYSADGARTEAQQHAQNLAVMAGSLGLASLAALAGQIELRCRNGQPFVDLVEQLAVESELATERIERWLASTRRQAAEA